MTFTTAQLGHAFSYPQLRAEVPFKMSLALLSRLPVAPAALLIIYGAVRYGVDLSNIAVHWWNDLFWSVASLLAGIECLRVHRNLKDQSRAWLFFGLAHLSYFVGMLVWSFHELVLGQLNPFPSLADIGFLAVALFFALGISGANPESRRWGLNFSKVATIATGTLLITAVWLADAVAEAQTDWLYTTVAMAWAVSFSTVFIYGCAVFWTNQGATQGLASLLIIAALGVHAIVSVIYTEALLRNAYGVGSWFDILWIFAFSLFWYAARERQRAPQGVRFESGPTDDGFERETPTDEIERIGVADALISAVVIAGTLGALISSAATPQYLDRVLLVLGAAFSAAVAWRGWEFYQARARILAERQSSVVRLREFSAAAEAGSNAKTDFLSAMSHEIRTPLSGLLGVADLLRAEQLTDKQREYVSSIRSSGRHLLNVINDILDFSRIESGNLHVEQIDFSLPVVLERLRSLVHPMAVERGLDLRFHLSEHSPPVLKGDPTRLKQVLLNLVGNAIKFTEKGSVTLNVSSEAVTEGQLRFRFEVRDTGIGIAPEKQAELFSAFTQADRSIARRFGGSGLGLAISKRLANAMGGEIGVNSAPGLGSVFWLEVPFELGNPANLERGQNLQFAQVQPRRVLVAEDVKLNQDILRDMVSKQGHELVFANNGAEAVALAEKEPFDVILMDIQMPVMDGVEATRRIRRLPGPAKDVPIVALTANVMANERDKYLAAGMNECLMKPIDWEQLFAALARYGPQEAPSASPVAVMVADGEAVHSELDGVPLLDRPVIDRLAAAISAERLAPLLQQAVQQAAQSSDEFRTLEADPEGLAREAHKLKGTSGTCGLTRISKIAAEIETHAREGRDGGHLIGELVQATEATAQALQEAKLIPQ